MYLLLDMCLCGLRRPIIVVGGHVLLQQESAARSAPVGIYVFGASENVRSVVKDMLPSPPSAARKSAAMIMNNEFVDIAASVLV